MLFKILIACFLIFTNFATINAQQKKIDSLIKVLDKYKKEDTKKAQLMMDIAKLSLYVNAKTTLRMSKELATLGRKLNYDQAIFSSMEMEAACFLLSFKLDSASLVYHKMLEDAIKIKSNIFIASAKGGFANILLLKGKIDEAISKLNECVELAHQEKQYNLEGKYLVNIANAFNVKGDRITALKTALQALEINSRYSDKNSIAATNYLIGSLYGTSGQFGEALTYHKNYVQTQLELDNFKNACAGYIAVAADYEKLGKPDSAKVYNEKALRIAKENNLENLINKISTNLTQIKENDAKNEVSLNELLRLNKYYAERNMENDRGYILCKIAIGYATTSSDYFIKNKLDVVNRNKMVLDFLEEANVIAKKTNNYSLREESQRYLSLVYEKQQNYIKAYESYKKYIVLRDSAINESQQIATDRMAQQYFFNRKEDSLKLIQANTDAALSKQSFLNTQQQQNILFQKNELLLNEKTLFANNQQFILLNKDKELQRLAYLKTQADLQTEQLQNSEKEKAISIVQKEKLLQTAQLKTLSQENELNKLKQRQLLFYSIAVLATLLFLGVHFFNKNKAKQAQLRFELEKKEIEFQRNLADVSMSALRSQMNPHFIFNCLNSIKYYTTQNDNVAASNYLTKFSKLIRMALESSRSKTVTLATELESLELYIQMEVLRFSDKVKYSISVDKNIDTSFIEIPPMLLQPYAENAIWHGLMHKEDGGRIDIAVNEIPNENTLVITIKDNGVGREKSAILKSKSATEHKSYGTKVTSERLNLINQIYNTKASVITNDVIENGNVMGTLVTIKIPFQ